jgi:hypothetical protein
MLMAMNIRNVIKKRLKFFRVALTEVEKFTDIQHLKHDIHLIYN